MATQTRQSAKAQEAAKAQQTKAQQSGANRHLSDDELKRTLYLLKLCRYFDERM